MEEIFSKNVKRAKEQNEGLFLEETYTPHSMGYTTAVHMVEAGVPLLVIKQFLGHIPILPKSQFDLRGSAAL